ncbi:MAG: hypothetical protein A2Y62_17940 [Candidatus Fischerbacteria bacterium RBG_13_37_8]|uniref:Sigma-54 factor interaction domain-containing protein n=1 Tax=Candidatus Fischerbacteria bacterium RBG_13_37_8 TaxID=1817863 RepID=A0A1F5VTZ9_9BACT|nr:MAG: hypothetical protein A2Y62_17940 [Candidatus Fischerbacteria bacterium RBG_13_37_8]
MIFLFKNRKKDKRCSTDKLIILKERGIIGRGEEADYYLSHSSISRKHCEIGIIEGALMLKDLGSKNGTLVNNIRIKEIILNCGDMIQIGELHYKVENKKGKYVLTICERDKVMDNFKYYNIKESTSKFLDISDSKSTKEYKGQRCSQVLSNLRKKLGCSAIFLFELSPCNLVIREKDIADSYILSSTVINFMQEKYSSLSILNDKKMSLFYNKKLIEKVAIRGIWAPKDLTNKSLSLTGCYEYSVYCVPLGKHEDNVILLYAFWIEGCQSILQAEKDIQHFAEIIEPLTEHEWKDLSNHEIRHMQMSLSEPIIGCSPELLKTMKLIINVAATDFAVVLLGPRGCGKTTFARAIHELSHRKKYPFKAFNCANFQSTLIESELFGSKRGAYTGAIERTGHLVEANEGTIFIDSLESCSTEIQAKLLDVLEGRSFHIVGSNKDMYINVRFIAAINENPHALIKNDKLRLDFMDRIGVQFINIPPLWQRMEDIPELALYLLEREKKKCARVSKLKGFTSESIKALQSYYWPGNIRELCNVISRLLIHVKNDVTTEQDIINAINMSLEQNEFPILDNLFSLPYNEACKTFKSLYVQRKLAEASNNKSKAARFAKLTRRAFYQILNKKSKSN